VISQDVFAVEPWAVPERKLHPDLLPQSESIFALSNGHIGLGTLEDGEPAGREPTSTGSTTFVLCPMQRRATTIRSRARRALRAGVAEGRFRRVRRGDYGQA